MTRPPINPDRRKLAQQRLQRAKDRQVAKSRGPLQATQLSREDTEKLLADGPWGKDVKASDVPITPPSNGAPGAFNHITNPFDREVARLLALKGKAGNGAGPGTGGNGTAAGSANAKPGGNVGGAPQPAPIDPVDLWAKFDPPALPRGLLPPLLEEFASDRGTTMGCDMAGIAVGAIVVCAASIPDTIKLQVKRNDPEWRESARLWGALVGDVSEMKTPMMNTTIAPVRRIDDEMARNYLEAKSEWLRLPKCERAMTPGPRKLRARIMDVTVEAVQDILSDSPNGVLLDMDELSGWFGSMEKYSGSKGAQADRGFWLKAYNGGSYVTDRVSRDTVLIPNFSVSILGFIQPEPIRKVAKGGDDDGLLQRFIPIILRPAARGQDIVPGAVVADYDRLIMRLRKLRPPPSGNLYPPDAVLMFDDGALAIREALERKHRELIKIKSINRKLAAHIGKYDGIFARLCVVWHCIEHAGDTTIAAVITENTARRVASFMHDFLLKHAIAFYAGTLGLSDDHDRLANIAGYILAHQKTRLTNRDIQRGDRSMRNLKDYDTAPIFEQLEALGWLMRVPGPRFSAPLNWVVNPIVHQRFADRAKAERERRKRDREIIAEMFGKGKVDDT